MTRETDREPAVVVNAVSKSFRLPHDRSHTLKERALHPFRRATFDRLDALKNVSFSVDRGEFFGIVGRNGSGKSTLLKCLAGIYKADSGQIYVNGRMSAFIELGVGFNPDLAARDNVVLNAIMLGLSPREARARVDEVIEFAELEDFVDLKLKNYSSGMHVRLAFSVMIQVPADILLIDEVLAVGDAAFQQKCFDVFSRMRDDDRTILFVTHDMAAVQRFCHRALLIETGEVRLIGTPERVGNHYVELNFGRDSGPADPNDEEEEEERYGDRTAEFVEAWFEDEDGERRAALPQGKPCTFKARIKFREDVTDPVIAVLFENDQHHPLFATSTEIIEENTGDRTGAYRAGEELTFSVTFDNAFTPGRLFASPWMIHYGHGGANVIDRRPRMTTVVVTGIHNTGGVVDLPHEVGVQNDSRTLATRSA